MGRPTDLLARCFKGPVERSTLYVVPDSVKVSSAHQSTFRREGDEAALAILTNMMAPIVDRIDGPAVGRLNVGVVIGIMILGLAILIVVCLASWWYAWLVCEADQKVLRFPVLDTPKRLAYAWAA